MVDSSTVDISCRGARDFVRTYFNSLDSEARIQILPRLHRANSLTSWNGTPLTPDLLADFLSKLPESRHDVQSIDVHPVLGTTPAPLQITVTGIVLHFSPPVIDPSASTGTAPSPSKIPPPSLTEYKKPRTADEIEKLPRVFHATFLLLPGAGEGMTYYIGSCMYRFVG